jgi:hypothetical protein
VDDRDARLGPVIAAIVADDGARLTSLLEADPELARTQLAVGATRESAREFRIEAIGHYLYKGDSPLHIAAAAYRPSMIRDLVRHGADVAARNRRGAQPLHYAVDGMPGSPRWDPVAQRETVEALLEAGADPNATDRSGVGPLHRAVRTRCTAAVAALLDGGADPDRPNKKGSTPLQLATWTTGRGGSGTPEARAQQVEIVRLLGRALGPR